MENKKAWSGDVPARLFSHKKGFQIPESPLLSFFLFNSESQNLHEQAGGDIASPPPIAIHVVDFVLHSQKMFVVIED